MNVQERQISLVNEAKALAFFFNVSSSKLVAALKAFDVLYESTENVSPDDFDEALNTIDAEIERLCIDNSISDEQLEDYMENNFAFKGVTF